ncbi:MAG: peptidoglycan-binding domain-containing protein [Pseudomonadota bacterium]
MSDDWAFAKLAKPVCRGKALAFADRPATGRRETRAAERRRARRRARQTRQTARTRRGDEGGPLFMIAYHGDRRLDHRWLSSDCSFKPARRPGLMFHTCDSFKGSSGAPILKRTAQGPVVVGINVGTYELSRYKVIRHRTRNGRLRSRRRLIERSVVNVAIAPKQFAQGIGRFGREDLLRNVEEFREVQSSLRVRQLYGGRIDGIMGPQTRRALMLFERQQGLPEMGLPTQQIRDRLRPRGNRLIERQQRQQRRRGVGPAS